MIFSSIAMASNGWGARWISSMLIQAANHPDQVFPLTTVLVHRPWSGSAVLLLRDLP
jgi:hypothetical protein